MATKALHALYSTHVAPGPHRLDALADLIGLQTNNSKRNRDALIKAHMALKDAGFLVDFEVVEDSVQVKFGADGVRASAGAGSAEKAGACTVNATVGIS